MKIIYTIQHPAHVHLFRNSIKELEKGGHEIHTFVREKDVNIELLSKYDIDYTKLAGEPLTPYHLPFVQLKYEWRIILAAQKINPDVLVSMGEPAITHAAKVCGGKSLIFTDTELATLQNVLAFPFADKIYTPESYQDDIGPKQVRYPGYHELAYLHPNQFDPDPTIVEQAGVDPEEKYVILRLVSWDAAHDVGDSGIDDVVDVVTAIENAGARVLITSEADLPQEIKDRRLKSEPHNIHHLLAYADLFMGESATMATESAVLGTPAVFVSSSRRGYTDELEDEYGLVFNYSGPQRQSDGLERTISILENYDPMEWNQKRERVLRDKKDTTKIIVNQITRW